MCINPNCNETKIRCRGMCAKCYSRYLRTGSFDYTRIIGNVECLFCHTTDSPDGVWRKGYCTNCYNRLRLTGSLGYKFGEQIRGTTSCIDCGTTNPGKQGTWQKQRCIKCYATYRRREAGKKSRLTGITECIKCGTTDSGMDSFKRGLCRRCYDAEPDIQPRNKIRSRRNSQKRRGVYLWNQLSEDITKSIFSTDKCVWCDEKIETVNWEHFVPIANGGQTIIGNYYPVCSQCNLTKWKHNVEYWGQKRFGKINFQLKYKQIMDLLDKCVEAYMEQTND